MFRVLACLLLGCLLGTSLPPSPTQGVARAADSWDFNNDAWARLRERTPAERNVYRPTWLPARFRQPAVVTTVGLLFGVIYDSDAGDRLFLGSAANSCGGNSTTSEPITVLGHQGVLMTSTDCAPIWFSWGEGDQFYRVVGYAFNGTAAPSREEMRRIAANLAPVGADGRPVVSAGPPTRECFAETGRCIAGRFLDRWRATGGATVNGLPLTDERTERLEDGNAYAVQYFERARLEYHPENPAPYDVLLGQFGRRVRPADPPVAPQSDAPQYFSETGHNLSGLFYQHWREYGLAQFGYPISEVITETLEDGKPYRVQYFERARFEYHPENQAPYDVLLGQFGWRVLGGGAARTLALEPTSGPCPDARTSVVARGGGFAPDVVARFTIRRDRDGEVTGGNSTSGGRPTNADGSYERTLPLSGCGPDEPVGATFTVTVAEYYPERTPVNGPGVSAMFTVTAP